MSGPTNPSAFSVVMTKVFRLPSQTLWAWQAELKALSFDDKLWYANALRAAGHTCDDPISLTASSNPVSNNPAAEGGADVYAVSA